MKLACIAPTATRRRHALSRDDAGARKETGATQTEGHRGIATNYTMWLLTAVSKFVTQRLFGSLPTGDHEKRPAADRCLVGVPALLDRFTAFVHIPGASRQPVRHVVVRADVDTLSSGCVRTEDI